MFVINVCTQSTLTQSSKQSRERGVLHHELYDFQSTFGSDFGMDKRERLIYGESLMTHAMVFTAYDREQVSDVDGKAGRNAPVYGADDESKAAGAAGAGGGGGGGAGGESGEDVEQKVIKWRVENSWGTDKGDKGYLAMSDGWYREWVYQIAVHVNMLDENLLKILNEKPTTLPAWDPMGALAKSM